MKIGMPISLLILFGSVLCGCGVYTFGGNVPAHLSSIAIPTFENQTAEYGLAEQLTDEVVDRFTVDGSLQVRDSRSSDCVISGLIVRVTDAPFGYNADESVDEYKITITVNVSFQDRVRGEIVWEETLTQFGVYPFTSGSRAERQTGVDEAVEKLAVDILNKTVSGW